MQQYVRVYSTLFGQIFENKITCVICSTRTSWDYGDSLVYGRRFGNIFATGDTHRTKVSIKVTQTKCLRKCLYKIVHFVKVRITNTIDLIRHLTNLQYN